jgi:hypothetical protein
MQAFHNKSEIQKEYLDRVIAHSKADEIIKGKYWEDGKGCAVGCTVHSSSHRAYETELGIPMWLARMEDRIFEGLPSARAKKFPLEFLSAVNLGADLEKIKIPMLIFILESARTHTKNERSLKAIDGVLLQLRKDVLDLPALREARAAAYDAAVYDASAAAAAYAYAAAYDAYAYASAAAAAYAYASAAAAAADAAAYAAAYAADAARENEYTKFADKLLELIHACK